MPHCVIEYAAPLDEGQAIEALTREVFTAAKETGLFNPAAIKVRAVAYDSYYSETEVQPFVHTTVKILAGRTAEQKKSLGEAVLAAKRVRFEGRALLSVEVADLGDYFK